MAACDDPVDSPDDQYTLSIEIEGDGETIPSEGEHKKDSDKVDLQFFYSTVKNHDLFIKITGENRVF